MCFYLVIRIVYNMRHIHFTSNNVLLLQCSEKRCDSFIAMHLGVLEHPRYLVNMTFTGLEIVDKHFNIENIIFTISTYRFTFLFIKRFRSMKLVCSKVICFCFLFSPAFTEVEVWFRFFYVLATVVVMAGYYMFSR